MKFVNLRKKKFFLQNLLPGWARLKKKIQPAGGSETTVFFTLTLLPASRGSNVMIFIPS